MNSSGPYSAAAPGFRAALREQLEQLLVTSRILGAARGTRQAIGTPDALRHPHDAGDRADRDQGAGRDTLSGQVLPTPGGR
jgi:hypothetical protein